MISQREMVARAIGLLRIQTGQQIQFAEEPPLNLGFGPAYPSGVESKHPLPAGPLTAAIQSVLYDRCYAHEPLEAREAPVPDPAIRQRLSAANAARDGWDYGWQVYQLGANGQVFILKGERQRSAVPGEFIVTGAPGFAPQVGHGVTLRIVRESDAVQPDFFFMFSETPTDVWDDFYLVRFYFHSTADGAPSVVRYLTSGLNRYQIPYRMKALSDSTLYTRRDAIVLYVARRYHAIPESLVREMPEDVAAALKPSVPLFTKMMRPGVGLAEDPRTGESFGMHRCRLVAEGLINAWARGQHMEADRMSALDAQFASAGLSLDRPWLNPASVDIFDCGLAVETPITESSHAAVS
ncbi:MAG TPA: T3SS effector HopA1 family protein [Bryobacteraceae bacterium]|jgi:hypothetical protein